MKILIVTAGISVVFLLFIAFQVDHNRYLEQQVEIKSAAQDAADAAALYYDQESYAIGKKIFDQAEGIKAAQAIIENQTMLPAGIHYTVYFLDESGMSTYQGGAFVGIANITLPYLFTELQTGYTKQINNSTVIVTIDAGTFEYTLPFLSDPPLIRTSSYEYVGR